MAGCDLLLDNIDFLFRDTETIEKLLKKYLEKIIFISKSPFGALYAVNKAGIRERKLKLLKKIGNFDAPNFISSDNDLFYFFNISREFVVLTERKDSPFSTVLLNEEVNAGIGIPFFLKGSIYSVIILNFIDKENLNFGIMENVEKFNKLIAVMQNRLNLK